ncbi:MAG TPA: universal stress protein [Phnomibacter sp.]|nr:universal stress protein [Phnomibacter sp.]
MKNILVPTDLSANALKALNYAAALAQKCDAALHILHTYTLLENVFIEGKSMRDAWNEQQKKEKGAELLRIRQDLAEKYPHVRAECHLFTGPTEDAILQYSEKASIDLIVMGTQGASGLAEILVGSVTAGIIGRSKVPVLAIPRDHVPGEHSGMVLATRGFERDHHLVGPVFELAAIFDIVVDVLVFANEDQADVEIIEKTMELESYVAYLRKTFPLCRIQARLVEGVDLETALQEYCEENERGIICMLTYKRGFWQQIFNPSLTKKVAYHTHTPLLAIPV